MCDCLPSSVSYLWPCHQRYYTSFTRHWTPQDVQGGTGRGGTSAILNLGASSWARSNPGTWLQPTESSESWFVRVLPTPSCFPLKINHRLCLNLQCYPQKDRFVIKLPKDFLFVSESPTEDWNCFSLLTKKSFFENPPTQEWKRLVPTYIWKLDLCFLILNRKLFKMFKKEIGVEWLFLEIVEYDLSYKRGSVGSSEALLIHRSSVLFSPKPENSILMDLNFADPQSRVLNCCWK